MGSDRLPKGMYWAARALADAATPPALRSITQKQDDPCCRRHAETLKLAH
jgi:hypothetical protein